ncbi:MAG: YfiR family protein [Bacteroidetes bacterium]|nr:YfiR family protein [Bacteroidota bacterium]
MKLNLLLVVCLLCTSGYGQHYETKKIYVYSFAKMVQWPDDYRQGDFEIAVLGETPFFEQLTDMASKKKLGERSIKVVKVGSLAEFKKSHILVLPANQSGALADALKKVGANPTLIVTEQDGFGAKGSDINFVMKDNKLAFELNQATLTKHKLKAANELIRLAILL